MTFNCLSDKIGIIFGTVQFGKMAKISTCDTIAQKVCMKVYIIVKRTHVFLTDVVNAQFKCQPTD